MSSQKSLDDLVQTLNLEKLEENLYRGECEKTAWGRVFGGQVLGQALSAAYNTIEEERYAHSFHAYFFEARKNRHPHCLSSSKNKRRRKFYNENS